MLEIDPFHSLALSLHHSRGVYALLVGSGLSRAAGIPTGWEITLGLISRLAALDGVADQPNWEQWYKGRYGKEPKYSEILDALASTPAERRSILHSSIEPDEDEDARRPTKAHHAIARLVADGIVRVIITTNFDRLIENALRDAGVEPTVIASEDALAGATPLVHSRCTLVKLHGDYLDTRIKNTDMELSSYPAGISGCLDEIFDRFGLLVVGWSGEWDTALRDALMRAPSHRYAMYWAARGPLSALAQDIINHRDGRPFAIEDADSFFARLADTVDALQKASRPHPLTVAAATAVAKKYCRRDEYGLEWMEFLAREVGQIREFVTGPDYPTGHPNPPLLKALVDTFIVRTEIIRRACLISARWGSAQANDAVVKTLQSLALNSTATSGFKDWITLRDFPAMICFYWTLVGALYRDDLQVFHRFLHAPIRRNGRLQGPAVFCLPATTFDSFSWKFLTTQNALTPASDLLVSVLKAEIGDVAIDSDELDEIFDRLEFLISLEFAHLRLDEMERTGIWFWTPVGRYIWRHSGDARKVLLAEYTAMSIDHPALKAGLLGGNSERASHVVAAVRDFLQQVPSW